MKSRKHKQTNLEILFYTELTTEIFSFLVEIVTGHFVMLCYVMFNVSATGEGVIRLKQVQY